MATSKITRVIGVADMSRATQFYIEALGLSVEMESPVWTDLTCGNGNLALQAHQPDAQRDAPVHTMVIFTVSDLEQAIRAVHDAGGALIERHDNPHALVIIAHVTDTENNVIQLAELKR